MGDASDDTYEAAIDEKNDWQILLSLCPTDSNNCDWVIDDDGLWLCLVCGERADL